MPTRLEESQAQERWIVPLLERYLTRQTLHALLRECAPGVRLYWRTLTPLVTLWGLIYQRLGGGVPLDAVVCAIQAGAADGLDRADPHAAPLSQRLRSVSTAAYHQARQRLPLALIQAVRARLSAQALHAITGRPARGLPGWRGHAVRWLDGTTFRLPPAGDLPASYGRARGKCGVSHWVTAQAVVTFCWASWLVVAHAESAHAPSETTLVRHVLDPATAEPAGRGTLYVADRGFGIYRTVQVAAYYGQHLLLRLDARHVPTLLGHPGGGLPVAASGREWPICWGYRPQVACEADLPCPAVPGRVLYVQVRRRGFRPQPLYLFTTLADPQMAPLAELVALYLSRWQVELRYRDLKTTLQMESFAVRSTAMFAKELEIGLLTYTLIRLAMVAAAPSLPAARRLAFAACRRRVQATWNQPAAPDATVAHPQTAAAARRALLSRQRQHLAACRRPPQRHKVAHEPRAVRRPPQVYPALKGDRHAARTAYLQALGSISS